MRIHEIRGPKESGILPFGLLYTWRRKLEGFRGLELYNFLIKDEYMYKVLTNIFFLDLNCR